MEEMMTMKERLARVEKIANQSAGGYLLVGFLMGFLMNYWIK
jgi:hypothetical protein